MDFDTWSIEVEKPDASVPQEIHDLIGVDDDRSLFGWTLNHFSSGWLTCDDGSGEIADFIHLDKSGTLSIIHVKAANSSSPTRRISVNAYALVASQAVKNIGSLQPEVLAKRLAQSPVQEPATWTNGVRSSNRNEMIEALQDRSSADESQIVIVQPHVRQDLVTSLRSSDTGSADHRRLTLLDNLLNSTRGPIAGLGGELHVFGSSG